jgi:hypothetical protein
MKRLFCVLVAVATIACAGHLSVKQTGTASLKTFDALLSHAQDVEKQNVTAFHLDVAAAPELVARCVPQRADGTPAPNPTKHQVIACFFRKAFTNEARAARALETYKPGDPGPDGPDRAARRRGRGHRRRESARAERDRLPVRVAGRRR